MSLIASTPVLSCAQAKQWEAAHLRDASAEWAAMQRAGRAVADAVQEDFCEVGGFPSEGRVLVVTGKGHNGGDALLAAAELLRAHPQIFVDVVLVFSANDFKPLARRAWRALKKRGARRVRILSLADVERNAYALCLDGVFGFQFRLSMPATTENLLTRINAHPRIRLRAAVDLPSGLAEAGAADVVFHADFTYATGIVKAPVLADANAGHVGRVRYLDLGFFADESPASSARVLLPTILEPLATLRPAQTDKRKFGHVFVVGGSLSYPGAVLLAVRAALHSGVGLITAFVPELLVPQYAATHPEVMWVGCPVGRTGGLNAKMLPLVRQRMARASALLIGPGLGADAATLALVAKLAAQSTVPLVLDADALRPEVIAAAKNKPLICTPHAGEYQRIEGALAQTPSAVVVRKGPITQVRAGGHVYYSLFGGPVLARGGSGDILAGLTAGLLAQAPGDPALAACRGVTWHGLAADLLARARGQVAVETSQLIEQLGPALASSYVRTSDGTSGLHGPERPAQHRPDHAQSAARRVR